ncbi:peroxiredoxin [Deinococcus arcticus]|uniref:thioredoxin-dependent peroxiredoxin n=1 Tax=Deinococcus arcticus TaxID=2136176 RepID=A0A2T3W8C9_9DEIO|nr:peroxiredoxin [Deinococcus arcticus]PTA68158.1 peroxiredoxin [Deinococcus arcticus]
MTLRVGQSAPDFTRRSDDGREISLDALRGRWTVLYFYPRAGSAGCSIEAQRFEAALPEFERLGAQVIGVSTDTEAKQAAFRDSCSLSYPLLPDSDRSLCRAYGVMGGLGGLLNMAARATFLIDPQGTVAWTHRSANPMSHVTGALKALEQHQQP